MRRAITAAVLSLVVALTVSSALGAEPKALPFTTDCDSVATWRNGGVTFFRITGQGCSVLVARGVYVVDHQTGDGAASTGVVWEPTRLVIQTSDGFALIAAKDGCVNGGTSDRTVQRCNSVYAKAT